jgi:GT2 family glycosyltransferase
LNPDTEVRPGALSALLDFMDAHPQAGIAGSGFENADGSRWPYAFRFPSLLSEVDQHLRLGVVTRLLSRFTVARTMPEHAERVDWLAGASMMIRRSVFDAVGLMDEGYFLYFEETDFCLEAARAGFETWYVPKSRVMHVMGQSTGVTGHQDEPRRLPGYWFESRSRYFVKNHGRLYGVVTDVLSLACFAAWRLRRIVQRKPDRDPPHFFGDLWRHSAMFRSSLPTNPRVGA